MSNPFSAMDDAPPALYSGARQHEKFNRMDDFFPSVPLLAASQARPFPKGAALALPEAYVFEGAEKDLQTFLSETDTVALLVLQDGKLRHEHYALTGGPAVRWISWSMAKSFVSALVGVAVAEGVIGSIDDSISDYATSLKGSAYEGVPIKHVLQMSSGARWHEDYSDPESDVNQLGAVMAGKQTLDAFVANIPPDEPSGTHCRYNSADTQALGMLLRGATGGSLSAYMQAKLIEPLGFEDSGYWVSDHAGVEMVLGGLNLTARDYAKLGELYRHGGRVGDRQVLPEAWVAASTQVSAPHLAAGQVTVGGHKFAFGYGYQWWIPGGKQGDFSAIGVYNQFTYVNPKARATIVKLSANPRYGLSELESDNRDEENMAVLRAIAGSMS